MKVMNHRFKIALSLILFCQLNLTLSGQDLNSEFDRFTKDPVTLVAMNNRYVLDSILFFNKISHPKITADLVRKIMVQPDYCEQYSVGGCPINVIDIDCMLCLEENTSRYLTNKYPTIFDNKVYSTKVERYLNSKMKLKYSSK